MIVRCLTIWQPWASLLVTGIKQYETRGWQMHHTGLLLIHAGKANTSLGCSTWHDQQIYKRPEFAGMQFGNLPFGAVVGMVRVDHYASTTELLEAGKITPMEFALGNYEPDRWAFCCTEATRFAEPIPMVGRQGLFNVDTEKFPRLVDQVHYALLRSKSADERFAELLSVHVVNATNE